MQGSSTFRTQDGQEGEDITADDGNETVSAAPTKTTLNDLLDTLKLLEEPVNEPEEEKEKKNKGPAWCKKSILCCLTVLVKLCDGVLE